MIRQLLAVAVCFVVIGQLAAQEKRSAGLDDLVILSPGTHERGLAAVQLKAAPDGTLKVDITPSIHIHRNYYNGDREYQGPFVAGGPTMIVANHPSSNKRLYIEANLPAGYPTIAYDGNSITYAYEKERVVIFYSIICTDKATVFNLSGRGIGREAREHIMEAKKVTKQTLNKSPLVGTLRNGATASRDFFLGFYDLGEQVIDTTLQTAGKIVAIVPGVQPLRSLGEQFNERRYQSEMRNEAEQARRRATEFVKTVR
jgi:hypothetical protein